MAGNNPFAALMSDGEEEVDGPSLEMDVPATQATPSVSDEDLQTTIRVLEMLHSSEEINTPRLRGLRKALHPLLEQQLHSYGVSTKRAREGEPKGRRKRRAREEGHRRGQSMPEAPSTASVSRVISSAGSHEKYGDVVEVGREFISRLLYTNPVCLLTTRASGADAEKVRDDVLHSVTHIVRSEITGDSSTPISSDEMKNVMTISWLTPISNDGTFVCSVNNKRHSLRLIRETKCFALNVPVEGMEDLVRAIGSCHGDTRDKITDLSLTPCSPGWGPSAQGDDYWAVSACVAHLCCRVTAVNATAHPEHTLFTCAVERAFVRSNYWSGKTFIAQLPELPSYLTFLGSRTFAYVHAQANENK